MAEEISELLVRVRPEGIEETEEGLDGLSDSFEESADDTKQAAGVLSDLSDRLKGSSAVILAGLATIAAGLLSKIPVIGDAMSGLGAILTAIQLRIDEALRPALRGVIGDLFGLADALLLANGPLGDLLDIVLIASVTFLGLLVVAGLLAGAFLAISAAAGIVGVSLLPILAVLGLIALAVGILAVAWKNNWLGIRDITADVLEFLLSKVKAFVGFVGPFIKDFLAAVFEGRWVDALGVVLNFTGAVVLRLIELFEKWAAAVRTVFEAAGAFVVSALKRMGNRAVSVIESAINRVINGLPDFVKTELGISTVNLGQPFNARSAGAIRRQAGQRLQSRFGAAESRRQSRESELERQVQKIVGALQDSEQTTVVEIDGREAGRSVEPFIGTGAANAGRTNRVR